MVNADACVNFACKRPSFADVGGGLVKKGQNYADILYGWPLNCFLSISPSRSLRIDGSYTAVFLEVSDVLRHLHMAWVGQQFQITAFRSVQASMTSV